MYLSGSPAPPKVLYQANWRSSTAGWTAGGGAWPVRNGLLTNTSDDSSTFVAPYTVTRTSYALEATIRLVSWRYSSESENNAFGVLFRGAGKGQGNPASGLMGGVVRGFLGCAGLFSWAAIATADVDSEVLKQNSTFRPGNGWHRYRVEVRGNRLRLLVDGRERNAVTSTRFARGLRVGLFSLAGRIQVSGFRVLTR
jgi:hypothetical protein